MTLFLHKTTIGIAVSAFMLFVLHNGVWAEASYTDYADPRHEIAQRQQLATEQHKSFLLIFGADWCKTCTRLGTYMSEDPIVADLLKHYVYLKIDVGRFDKNKALARSFGVDIDKGIPALVLFSPGKVSLYNDLYDDLYLDSLKVFLSAGIGGSK